MTSSVTGPRRSSKALPKAKLAPKKVIITVWWSAAHLIRQSFLNPGETIISEKYAQQISEITKNCSRYQSTERAQFFSMTTPDQRSHNQKLKELGYDVLPHPPYSPDLGQWTTTSSIILTTFCRKSSTTSRIQKMLSKSSLNSEALIFMLQE